jgi:hypothetical protein
MIATSLLASTVAAPAADAAGTHWGPIYAKSGQTNVASADGDFANNGGVYATVGANWHDLRADGNPVFIRVEFFFLIKGSWESAGDTESSRTTTNASGALSRRLRVDATAARAAIHVCADRAAIPDTCSRDAIVSFNY